MFALIHQGVIQQLSGTTFPVSQSLSWLDVTSWEPQPQTGWHTDGQSPQEMLAALETAKQDYIDAHYTRPIREELTVYAESPAATDAGKALCMAAWQWVNTEVMPYFRAKQDEIKSGKTWTEAAVDFSQFNVTDPKITDIQVLKA